VHYSRLNSVLRDIFLLEAVVFIIDDTTDLDFLKSTFNQLWKAISSDSPNKNEAVLGAGKPTRITIYRMAASKRKSKQR
jgi:hypothetical protein